jgi:dTMP kinase
MGLLITLEGCEGCGKSTQSRSLRRRLTALSLPVLLVHEPGGTRLGQRVAYLLKWTKNVPISPLAELLLFNSSRANLVDQVMRPALAQGSIVICDRFTDSSIAYQGHGRGLNLKTVKSACDTATGGLRPDLTVLLDVPVEEGLRRKASRGGHDRFEQTDVAFHNRVRAGYATMAAEESWRWLVVDGTRPRDEIERTVWDRVSQVLSYGDPRMKDVFNEIWRLALPYQDQRDDAGHAEVALDYARGLVASENGNHDIIIPAIILHDVGYSQLPKERRLLVFSRTAPEEERRAVAIEHQNASVKLAGEILGKLEYPAAMTAEIMEIISQHDTRRGFISKNEGLVRDADKLWRYSQRGFEAGAKRRKTGEAPRWNEIEADVDRADYFYSERAKQLARAELSARKAETGAQP